LEFIDDRMNKLGHEIDSVAKIKLAYQQKNDLIDVETQSESYFNVLSESDASINIAQEKLGMAQMSSNYLTDKKTEHETFKLVPSSLGLEDITLGQLIQAYNVAQLERNSLVEGGTPESNPVIKQKEAQIEELRQRSLESLGNIKQAITSQINLLKSKNSIAQS